MLDKKRKQLEEEGEEAQVVGAVVRHTLPQAIKHIQLDLQDLMHQLSSQVFSSIIACPRFSAQKHSKNSFSFFRR